MVAELQTDMDFGTAVVLKTVSPFDGFFGYEAGQINRAAMGVLSGNWMGPSGVVKSVINFAVRGPGWWFGRHPLFFAILLLWGLLLWSIFGGAIARIAAVHVARDEKLSVRQAIRFSTGKFLSFAFAPIIPLILVLVLGAVLAAGGLALYVPYVGPIVVSLLFFLALALALVMTLLVVGTFAGLNLMYPTVAVEGSDSFDAISRSFSYVYARPWRMLFYTAVALAYGAITYVFVRLFLFLLLGLAHYFVTWWVGGVSGEVWNAMWPGPSNPWRLSYEIDLGALSGADRIAAGILSFWVYLAIGLLGAFAISFYFSANTIIYYLMRQEVDATELDDVYLGQSDEDFVEPAAPETPAPALATTPAPVEEKPAV